MTNCPLRHEWCTGPDSRLGVKCGKCLILSCLSDNVREKVSY